MNLPEAEAKILKELRASGDKDALRSKVAALRAQKWTLRTIADAVGVSRTTIQDWERGAPQSDEPPDATLSPKAIETAGDKTVRWRSHIKRVDKERLARLAPQAQKVRSQTPAESPLRQAADLLDLTIVYYIERMTAITEIAEAMGVTHRAVKARLERMVESD